MLGKKRIHNPGPVFPPQHFGPDPAGPPTEVIEDAASVQYEHAGYKGGTNTMPGDDVFAAIKQYESHYGTRSRYLMIQSLLSGPFVSDDKRKRFETAYRHVPQYLGAALEPANLKTAKRSMEQKRDALKILQMLEEQPYIQEPLKIIRERVEELVPEELQTIEQFSWEERQEEYV